MKQFYLKYKSEIGEFFCFFLIGVMNFLVDFGIFMLLTRVCNMNEVAAKAISYPCGVINSFFFNSRFTFRVKMKFLSLDFAKFVLVNLISYGVSLLAVYILTQLYFVIDWIANLIATAFSFVVNYAGNKFIVFSNKEKGK